MFRTELLDALDARRVVIVHHTRDDLDCALVGRVCVVDRQHAVFELADGDTRTVPLAPMTSVAYASTADA